MGCPTGWLIMYFCVQLHFVVQNSSEVSGGGYILGWSEPCSLQGLINVYRGLLELRTCRQLACWMIN